MDVEEMIRGTDHLRRLEAAGIMVDCSRLVAVPQGIRDQFDDANHPAPRSQSCAWTTGPAARSTPKHNAPRRGKRRPCAGPVRTETRARRTGHR